MKTKHLFFATMILAFVLTACGQPTPAAPNQAAIDQQIGTSVAQTVAAGEALTAAAQPSETPLPPPTNTSFPTLTPFPTITPFVVTPASGGGGSGGSGGSGGGGTWYGGEQCGDDPKYMGAIIDQFPHDDSPETILKTGDPLDVFFTIKNVGTKDWEATFAWAVIDEDVNSDDPYNLSLSTYPYAVPPMLGTTVEPGEFITLGGHLTAPANIEGRNSVDFVVRFAIVGYGVKFCQPWVRVTVVRPGMTP